MPLTVDSIPARITLEVTDGDVTEVDAYEPFHRLPFGLPLAPYEGNTVIRRPVYDDESSQLSTVSQCSYSITVKSPDGENLYGSGPLEMRMPRIGTRGPRADRISLVIDRLGGVIVRLGSGFTHEEDADVILDPPWQPDLKRADTLRSYLERGRARLERGPAVVRALPYGGSLHSAYGDRQRRA